MRFLADLHIHSPYSRATSKEMTLEGIAQWAKIKGITLMGTGDFTHPGWFEELKEKLEETPKGLYRLKNDQGVFFIPTSEISCIYSKGGRTRKVHLLIIMPGLSSCDEFNRRLSKIGNITADGRPILGFDPKALLETALEVNEQALLIPAHAWTPHFSIFGAFSGFDSIEECFEDLTPYVYAIETGLSSDPPMNWLVSELDRMILISNSDAHSPQRIGREANILDCSLDYPSIYKAIKTGEGFIGTIEFFPEEGKYHYDGHRDCGVSLEPEETKHLEGLCPVCKRPLTIGVMHRVMDLADRPRGYRPENARPFYSLVPLQEIIADVFKKGPNTKTVESLYQRMINTLGTEFEILLESPLVDIERVAGVVVAEGIRRVREGRVRVSPGFDGQYGRISLFDDTEKQELQGQGSLF